MTVGSIIEFIEIAADKVTPTGRKKTVTVFREIIFNRIYVVSSQKELTYRDTLQGVGYWKIGSNFVIS